MNQVVDRLVVVATFLEPNQAHIARARLEAEGIQAVLDGEHHVAMNWLVSNAIGGVKLLVPESELETAHEILQSSPPEILDQETGDLTEDDTESESCPSCHSTAVYRERLKRRMVFLSILLLGIPFPFISRKMTCNECGYRWTPRSS